MPPAFTQEQLWWEPWLPPVEQDALTPAQYEGLVERPRAALPYFRLLARDPGILRARTLADLDIFTNADGGLDRAERELAAAATSRLNGCVFCASVHARTAARLSKRRADVQRLLDDGASAAIDDRWDAIIAAAAALTRTPVAFGPAEVAALRAQGLSDQALVDLTSAAAFFNWANRLMLSIGEPRVSPEKLSVIRAYEATKTA
ncbi:MAG: alkylhydroperoxidase domain protein [Microbacterium sp.]